MMLPSMIAKGVDEEDYEEQRPMIDHGKFFPVVDEDDDDDESDDSSLVYVHGHHEVISVQEAKSRGTSIATPLPPSKDVSWHGIYTDLLKHLNPLDMDELKSSNWIMKIYVIIKR
uniref:Uncharacterized protein n=1 Tax=Acrobeloides nanus TaxID=290746 RepID=A0A914CW10_9BILA